MSLVRTGLLSSFLVGALSFSGVANAQIYINSTQSEPYVNLVSLPGIGPVTTLTFNSADDGQATATLPFTFNYLGQNFTQVNLGSNGYMTFGTENASSLGNQAPGTAGAPNNWIAPLWDDLLHPTTSNGRYGVIGTAPNRIFVIEGGPCTRFSGSGGTLMYQVWLYEGNTTHFSYRSTGMPVNPLGATIGYEGNNGTPFFNAGNCGSGVNCSVVPSGTTFITVLSETPELLGSVGNYPRGAFPNQSVQSQVSLRNLGVNTATSVISTIYLSVDDVLDAADPIVGTAGPTDVVGGNVPVTSSATITVPNGTPAADYYVILEVDSPNDWIEHLENDNVSTATGRFATAYDLQATGVASQNTIGANPGEMITFDITIANIGVPYAGDVTVQLYSSLDQIFDTNDPRLGDVTVTLTGLPSEVTQGTIVLPNLAPGVYFPIAVVDSGSLITELSEFNNTIVGPVTFPTGPDFAIASITPQTQVLPAASETITTRVDSAAVRFVGTVPYRLFASTDATLDTNDTLLGSFAVNFNQDDYIDDVQTVTWPAALLPGYYSIIGVVDPMPSSIAELNEGNNQATSATTVVNAYDFGIQTPVSFSPATAEAGDSISVTGALTSLGLTFTGNVPYRIYLSPNDIFDLADEPVLDATVFVAGLTSAQISTTFIVPNNIPVGHYYVILVADPADLTDEAKEDNNWAVSGTRLDVQGADLRVDAIGGNDVGFIGLPYRVTMAIQNDGIRDARDFSYAYYVSDNEIIRVTDVQVFVSAPMTIPAGQTVNVSDEITLPTYTSTQTKHIGVILDLFSQVPEDSEGNNIGKIPHEVSIVFPIPNLQAQIIETATAAAAGEQLAVTRILLNDGVAPANNYQYTYYFSTNPAIGPGDMEIGTFSGTLLEGQDDFGIDLIQVPSGISAGTYYLGLYLDPQDLVDEVNEDDNAAVGPSIPVFEAAIRIITDTLPNATIAVPYQVGVYARGGPLGIHWAIHEGTLPQGLTLDTATGIITGTPTVEGLSTFTLRALSGTAYADKVYNLRVGVPTVQLRIASTALQTAIVGRPYNTTLVAVGGVVPYTWELVSVPPRELTLAEDGTLSGIPMAPGGNRLIVRVNDALGNSASKEVALNIITANQSLVISQLPLPSGVVGLPYCGDEMITLEATGGVMPYTWSMVGTGASGMTLSAEGALCGTPETAGSFPIEIRVQDQTGLFDTALFIFEVDSGSDLAIATFELPAGQVAESYEATITAVRGEPPYTWAIIEDGGALPAGLTFDAGNIRGTPTAAGVFSFRVHVVDSKLRTDIQALSMVIDPAPENTIIDDKGCGCATVPNTRSDASSLFALFAIGGLLGLRARRRLLGTSIGTSLVALLAVGPAAAQTMVPGTPYVQLTTQIQYTDLPSPTVVFASGDDSTTDVTLPFPFHYYNLDYTTVSIGTNGAIVFGGGAQIYLSNLTMGNTSIPNAVLSPFWDDQYVFAGVGQIGTQVFGNTGDRVFVIEYKNVSRYFNSLSTFSFQIRLYEGPAARVQIDYGAITPAGSLFSATMGMEDETGARPISFAASGCNATCTDADFTALSNHRIELVQDPGIELVATSVTGPQFGFLGAQTSLQVGVSNLHGAVIGPFGVEVIASHAADFSNAVTIHTSSITLNAFQSGVTNVTGVFPASLGTGLVYLRLLVDPNNAIPEFNENNNTVTGVSQTRLLQGAPDMAITRVVTQTSSALAGDSVPLSVRVTNVGGEPARDVPIVVVLSTNPVITPQDAELFRYSVTLDAGQDDARDVMVEIPADANSGVFYLGVFADPENALSELSESNNGLATSTTLQITGGDVAIITTALPVGYIRQSYVGLLIAIGGDVARTWTVVQGQLPVGIGLVAGTGELYGRPTRPERQTFTVRVTSNNTQDEQELTLEVVEPQSPLTVVTRDLTPAIVGQEYAFELIATGGTANSTLTWSGSNLPDGIEVSQIGLIGGVAMQEGDFNISVSVTNGSETASRDLVLSVHANSNLLISPTPMPRAVYGQPYSFQITSTGGISPITYLIELGRLPMGMEMSPTGLINGMPMEVSDEPFRIVVQARDAAPGRAQAKDVNTFELFVDDVAGFVIATDTIPDAYLNEGFDFTVHAEGGLEPYTWSVDGELPDGLSASTNPTTNALLIAGQPTALGLYTLTVKAVDSENRNTSKAIAIRVITRPVMDTPDKDTGGCGCSNTRSSSESAYSGFALLAFAFAAFALRRRG